MLQLEEDTTLIIFNLKTLEIANRLGKFQSFMHLFPSITFEKDIHIQINCDVKLSDLMLNYTLVYNHLFFFTIDL